MEVNRDNQIINEVITTNDIQWPKYDAKLSAIRKISETQKQSLLIRKTFMARKRYVEQELGEQ